jgi:Tol biopolymer transport system component
MLPLDGDRRPRPFAPVPSGRSRVAGALSPDGKWLAYGSNELGGTSYYVFVEPVPPTGAKQQVAADVASTPVWSRDGRRLFIAVARQVMAIDITPGPQLAFGAAVPLQTGLNLTNTQTTRNFDVMPTGGQLLLLVAPGAMNSRQSDPQLDIVVDWFEDLKRRLR